MRYILRAAKYFVCMMLVLVIFLAAMVLLHFVSADPAEMFRNGTDSLWQIACVLAVFSLIYPRFGYTSRDAVVPGDFAEASPVVVNYMRDRGYVLEKQEGEDMTFILASGLGRFTRFYEDRITMTRILAGWSVEGRSKDVIRIVSGIRSRQEL